jgi:hypothetical protein
MANLFWFILWTTLTGLLVVAGILLRLRLRNRLGRGGEAHVDDDAVRAILETGTLDDGASDPLDLDEIEEEERRFWSESWDEPEEW